MKNWKYIEGAKTGNADLSAISKHWSKTEIDHILQNAHVFKKEVVEEAKRLKEAEKNKTGNDTPWEYAHRKPKVINDDKTGAEEFFKQLSDDVKEREDKDDADIEKVGNATPNYRYKDFLITNPEGHEYIVFLKDGRTVGYRGTTSKAQAEDWCDWHDPKTGKSIGNKKLKFTDKKDGLKEFVYDEENDKGYIYYDGKLVDTILHAGQGWLNLIKQKAFSSGVMNKVGNKVVWKEGPYRIEEVEKDGKFGFYNIPKGSFNAYRNSVLYGNFKTLDSAKAKMNEEIRLDKEYNRKYTTNSKTGNVASEYEILKQDPSKMHPMYKKAYEEAMKKLAREDEEFKKRFEKEYGVKAKNEASDDKFAYVMREFDEGKLKTPDGKVVTDPAQAKAIAYSESKKAENGLARARNAMATNGLLDTVLSKTKHIKRFGVGSKVRAEGETGTVVKETVEVGPNGIPFGWVTVKFSDGKTRQYYDYDLKK
jgi:hypothetical protein